VQETKLRQYIRNVIKELQDEEELDEVTTTVDVDGYNTPNAFSSKEDEEKKKKKLTKSTGYSVVKESIDEKDIKLIKQLIRDVISDVYRDIWLKRNVWK
jgi:hypothetical protein|tara:strand:- start:546 stop:842 length:297 start_codon:yes stop_codon:yes gene_type:complete